MVDSSTDYVEIGAFASENLRDLILAVHFAAAQADRVDLAIFVACPCGHRVRIRIVEVQYTWGADFPHVLAEIEHCRDDALPVHDSADTKRIAHALVNTVFKRDFNVPLKCLQPPMRTEFMMYFASFNASRRLVVA